MIDGKAIKGIINKFMMDEATRAVIICDSEGLPIQSSFKGEQIERTEEISAYITSLISRAKKTAEVLGEGRLNFLRLETDKGEVMIAPPRRFDFNRFKVNFKLLILKVLSQLLILIILLFFLNFKENLH